MRKLIRRALKSIDRLDRERLNSLVKELADDNEELEMVLSSIPGGVIVVSKDSRILMVNKPAMRMIPLKTSDPIDAISWEIIDNEDLASHIKTALEEDRGAPMQDFNIHQGNRTLVVSCGVLPLVDGGRIRGNLVYMEDVTRKRMEETRLKQAERLASLTTMAAGVAHEIKNPLASMSIHIQLLKRRANENQIDQDDLSETLEILEEETERLNSIVSDYLIAVRPRSAQLDMADINVLITDLLQFLRFETRKAHVRVVPILDENIPSLPIDTGSMKQAILNLIKNALASMPDGGELKLQTGMEEGSLVITISDTGTGIEEEIQGKIFEPYFTTRDTGSGLGLTVVYKVIREHGGDLHLKSIVGRGTTFHITLPLAGKERKLLSGGAS